MNWRQIAAGAAATVGVALCALLPANAADTVTVLNGDFVGAVWALGPDAGQTAPAPFNFTAHTYLHNFAWGDTGCDCLDWVAQNGVQVIAHAPANPVGYSGNVYVADASPSYDQGTYLFQRLSGLTVGQVYTFTFEQASGSYYTPSQTKNIADTAQWVVGWGTETPVYGANSWSLATDATATTPLMTSGADGTSPWEWETVAFRATEATETLSFFATGSGLPPFALLANVSDPAAPEPSTWVMMGLGFGGLGLMAWRARRTRPAQA